MIDFYSYGTANGRKVAIMLEECGLAYQTHVVDIAKGAQKQPDFIKINPNGRIPAIVDHAPSNHWTGPAQDSSPLSVFESGAILVYLAEKTGKFLPTETRARAQVMAWVMWQMGGLGPMSGQLFHFIKYASEDVPYAKKRYFDEVARLLGVMEIQLSQTAFLGGNDYSIADMVSYPWLPAVKLMGLPVEKFPKVGLWEKTISARPAVVKGMKSPEV
ncbi:MAG: glutathione S-transferase N-terminal domain-containing protein [Candidatus Symbiobacter sp.]|nr:glutathione S-transferase N-terminal domain-containing protein [Candidatus Symbiobacter sp.]